MPISANLCKSIISPCIGVKSILKSPECTTTPAGVVIAMATASAILWLERINSTLKLSPILTVSPAFTLCLSMLFNKLCSFNLASIRPIVSFVPYTGTFKSLKRYGNEPIWSS